VTDKLIKSNRKTN